MPGPGSHLICGINELRGFGYNPLGIQELEVRINLHHQRIHASDPKPAEMCAESLRCRNSALIENRALRICSFKKEDKPQKEVPKGKARPIMPGLLPKVRSEEKHHLEPRRKPFRMDLAHGLEPSLFGIPQKPSLFGNGDLRHYLKLHPVAGFFDRFPGGQVHLSCRQIQRNVKAALGVREQRVIGGGADKCLIVNGEGAGHRI